MQAIDIHATLDRAEEGITDYLNNAHASGRIDQQAFETALRNTIPNLRDWLEDPLVDQIAKNLKSGIHRAVSRGQWENLVNTFRQKLRFGTGGIRGMMALDRDSIMKMNVEGIDTDILKGPNTINDLVLLLTSAGAARFGRDQRPPFKRIVIGYDSRIRGHDFARKIAELFLAYEYTVYFFDEPVPYPELTFAIPFGEIKADIGILISASHNDYRYNGYKLSCSNGSQFDPKERNEMYNTYISKATTAEIKLCSFADAPQDSLWFLGGDEPAAGFDYAGREDNLINVHSAHRRHVVRFLMTPDLVEQQRRAADPLRIAFCPFHGAGRKSVPRLLEEIGFRDIKTTTSAGLNELNGMFPSFRSDPGQEQQPDPGDPRAARIAVNAFRNEYPGVFEQETDILIGTDPDADRCGIVVKVPDDQQHIYGDEGYALFPADDIWTLLLWYRFHREQEASGGIQDSESRFVVLSHTTSEGIVQLARKHGVGVIQTWVGFAALSASVRDVWEGKHGAFRDLVEGRDETWAELCHPIVCHAYDMGPQRSFNIAAMEQSNGFSLLGGRPPDTRSLGEGGHVRDKDGTLAAVLVAEIAAWAKAQQTGIIELLDRHVYLDPDVGLFMTFYEPDPLDGEYPGIEGDRIKIAILRRTLALFQLALAGDLEIAGLPVKGATIYRTGKYDAIYPATFDFQFPDEGVRFYLDETSLSHLTIRPSGTGNSLRFHIQLHAIPTKANLIAEKERLRNLGRAIMDELREMLKAPRG